MLREFEKVRQHPDEGRRRWFVDNDFDLIVWYGRDAPEEIVGFQLCYDKKKSEHALTWRWTGSITHDRIDSGESPHGFNQTPILVADGEIPLQRLREQFATASTEIDPEIRALVQDRLAELAGDATR